MEGVRQYDLCANPDAATKAAFPYVLLLQHDFLSSLASTLIAPVARLRNVTVIPGVTIEIELDGERYLVLMQQLAPVRRSRLTKAVTNLDDRRSRIIAAIDLLFTGF